MTNTQEKDQERLPVPAAEAPKRDGKKNSEDISHLSRSVLWLQLWNGMLSVCMMLLIFRVCTICASLDTIAESLDLIRDSIDLCWKASSTLFEILKELADQCNLILA